MKTLITVLLRVLFSVCIMLFTTAVVAQTHNDKKARRKAKTLLSLPKKESDKKVHRRISFFTFLHKSEVRNERSRTSAKKAARNAGSAKRRIVKTEPRPEWDQPLFTRLRLSGQRAGISSGIQKTLVHRKLRLYIGSDMYTGRTQASLLPVGERPHSYSAPSPIVSVTEGESTNVNLLTGIAVFFGINTRLTKHLVLSLESGPEFLLSDPRGLPSASMISMPLYPANDTKQHDVTRDETVNMIISSLVLSYTF